MQSSILLLFILTSSKRAGIVSITEVRDSLLTSARIQWSHGESKAQSSCPSCVSGLCGLEVLGLCGPKSRGRFPLENEESNGMILWLHLQVILWVLRMYFRISFLHFVPISIGARGAAALGGISPISNFFLWGTVALNKMDERPK